MEMVCLGGGRFHLQKLIGKGAFGEVFLAIDLSSGFEVAMKIESANGTRQLAQEAKLYSKFAGCVHIPNLIWSGIEQNHHCIAIDLLGSSLEELFHAGNSCFSLKTVLMCADQMISAVEFIHKNNYIHRDIKPDNFLFSRHNPKLYVIDFGLAKCYIDPATNNHIRYVQGKTLTGTARYASVNALRGYEQSRRDDLEALGYCFMYFLRGSLPWMGLDVSSASRSLKEIGQMKMSTSFEELCDGFPREFLDYFHIVRGLKFSETPPYSLLRENFRSLFIRNGFVYDYKYDWVDDVTTCFQAMPQPQKSNNSLRVCHSGLSSVHAQPSLTRTANLQEGIDLAEASQMRMTGSTPSARRIKTQGPHQMGAHPNIHPVPRPAKKMSTPKRESGIGVTPRKLSFFNTGH